MKKSVKLSLFYLAILAGIFFMVFSFEIVSACIYGGSPYYQGGGCTTCSSTYKLNTNCGQYVTAGLLSSCGTCIGTCCDGTGTCQGSFAGAICICNAPNNCGTWPSCFAPYTSYHDNDTDGYGDPNDPYGSTQCNPPAGYVKNNTDCDDNDNLANVPGTCNKINSIKWTTLKDDNPITTAHVGDTVRMYVGGVDLNSNINFSVLSTSAILSWWWVVPSSSTQASSFWKLGGAPGDLFHFRAKINNVQNISEKLALLPQASSDDAFPEANITSLNDTYFTSVNYTFSLNQRSYDEDDLLNISWNFGDNRTYIPSTNGLISYYLLDLGAIDATGANGGVVYEAIQVTGVKGNALNFDGVNDYISLPDNPSLQPTTFTISTWVKPRTNPGGTIVGLHSNDAGMYMENSKIGCMTWYTGGIYNFNTGKTALAANNWYLLTCTFNGTSIKSYVNGVLENQTTSAGLTWEAISYAPKIGTSSNLVNFFKGDIDEVRIYNRSLSASEISEIYNQLKPINFTNYSLVLTPTLADTTYSYSSAGDYLLTLTATEISRFGFDKDTRNIMVLEPGIKFKTIISSPSASSYGNFIDFFAGNSYIINCTSGIMNKPNNFTAGNLNCSYMHAPGKKVIDPSEHYDIILNWTVRNQVGVIEWSNVGSWANNYSQVVNFSRFFASPGAHNVNLEMTYVAT